MEMPEMMINTVTRKKFRPRNTYDEVKILPRHMIDTPEPPVKDLAEQSIDKIAG
jgi:hypothetical protein